MNLTWTTEGENRFKVRSVKARRRKLTPPAKPFIQCHISKQMG